MVMVNLIKIATTHTLFRVAWTARHETRNLCRRQSLRRHRYRLILTSVRRKPIR